MRIFRTVLIAACLALPLPALAQLQPVGESLVVTFRADADGGSHPERAAVGYEVGDLEVDDRVCFIYTSDFRNETRNRVKVRGNVEVLEGGEVIAKGVARGRYNPRKDPLERCVNLDQPLQPGMVVLWAFRFTKRPDMDEDDEFSVGAASNPRLELTGASALGSGQAE